MFSFYHPTQNLFGTLTTLPLRCIEKKTNTDIGQIYLISGKIISWLYNYQLLTTEQKQVSGVQTNVYRYVIRNIQ